MHRLNGVLALSFTSALVAAHTEPEPCLIEPGIFRYSDGPGRPPVWRTLAGRLIQVTEIVGRACPGRESGSKVFCCQTAQYR